MSTELENAPTAGTNIRYSASKGSIFSNAEARVIGPELARLARGPDGTDRETILAAAKDPTSPLHSRFTWDDSAAANKWRLKEAGTMISAIMVEWDDASGETQQMRAFQSVRILAVTTEEEAKEEADRKAAPATVRPKVNTKGPRKFVSVATVIKEPVYCDQVIADAERDLISVRKRYNTFMNTLPKFKDKFSDVWTALDTLLDAE